jgi:hypothetical protein
MKIECGMTRTWKRSIISQINAPFEIRRIEGKLFKAFPRNTKKVAQATPFPNPERERPTG